MNDAKKILLHVKGWLFLLSVTCVIACNDSDDSRTLGIGVSANAGAAAVPGDSVKVTAVSQNLPLAQD